MRLSMLVATVLAVTGCVSAQQEARDSGMGVAASIPERITVLTNEPFYSARADGEAVVLTGVDLSARRLPVLARMVDRTGRRWEAGESGDRIMLHVTSVPCEDDMSGARYPFTAMLTIGGRTHRGCARPSDAPPPTVPGG